MIPLKKQNLSKVQNEQIQSSSRTQFKPLTKALKYLLLDAGMFCQCHVTVLPAHYCQ